jgi:chromosome segregation ATPase
MRMPGRSDHIARIEREIEEFREQATNLLRREHAAHVRLGRLNAAAREPHGRLRASRNARALRRAHRRLQELSDRREAFVEQGLRAIMLTLAEQSQRTRDRLDRELERLSPVQSEWERLRGAFSALEAAVATPAVEELAGQWRGRLEIPDFPVEEREGYLKPFPHGALLF